MERPLTRAERTAIRAVLRAANVGLALVCAGLGYGIFDDVAGALAWEPPPAEIARATSESERPKQRPWSERATILDRDLFHESIAGRIEPPPPVPEELKESALPIALLGTIASDDEAMDTAVIWIDDDQTRTVLAVGDEIAGGEATVVDIARGRVLLSEDGEVRELSFDADSEHRPPKRKYRRRRGRRFRR